MNVRAPRQRAPCHERKRARPRESQVRLCLPWPCARVSAPLPPLCIAPMCSTSDRNDPQPACSERISRSRTFALSPFPPSIFPNVQVPFATSLIVARPVCAQRRLFERVLLRARHRHTAKTGSCPAPPRKCGWSRARTAIQTGRCVGAPRRFKAKLYYGRCLSAVRFGHLLLGEGW